MELSNEMTRDMRRKLRMKLKDDLAKVQGLSSKLEARELQLRQPRMTSDHQSTSNSQFSGNDLPLRCANGKEVTSQLDATSNGIAHQNNQHAKQQSLSITNGRAMGTKEALSKKQTSKASKVCKKPGNGNPTVAQDSSKKQISKANELYKKHKLVDVKGDLPLSPNPTSTPGGKARQESGRNRRKTEQGPLVVLKKNMPQCKSILKKLMGHEDGWIFNEPVDAAHLGLSDYHSVIKKPMDLGTIKNKLDKKQYKSLSEFSDDVMLTFNNAMTYNPQGNDVHQSASVLLSTFQKYWDTFKKKRERNNSGKVNAVNDATLPNSEVDDSSGKTVLTKKASMQAKSSKAKGPLGRPKVPASKAKALVNSEASSKSKAMEARGKPKKDIGKPESVVKPKVSAKPKSAGNNETQAKSKVLPKSKASEKVKRSEKSKSTTPAKANVSKMVMTYEEKVKLQSTLGQLPQQILEELILLMKERNISMSQEGDEIEVDLDAFDDETLWELDRRAKAFLKKKPESRKRVRVMWLFGI